MFSSIIYTFKQTQMKESLLKRAAINASPYTLLTLDYNTTTNYSMFSPQFKLIKLIAVINGQPFTNVCWKEQEILSGEIYQHEGN